MPSMNPMRANALPDLNISIEMPIFLISFRAMRIEYMNNKVAGIIMTIYQKLRMFHQ